MKTFLKAAVLSLALWAGSAAAYGVGTFVWPHGNPDVSIAGVSTLTASSFQRYHVCTGGPYTITLPSATFANGQMIGFAIAPAYTGNLTIAPAAGTIDNAVNITAVAKQTLVLMCDGTNWRTVAGGGYGSTSPLSGVALLGAANNFTGTNTFTTAGVTSFVDGTVTLQIYSTNGDASYIRTSNNPLYLGTNNVARLGLSADGTDFFPISTATTSLGDATHVYSNLYTSKLALPIVCAPGTVQDVATGNTITLPTTSTKRLTATAGAATGVIVTAGTADGQILNLFNIHATNSITMAASGTSRVADGVSTVIAPLTGVTLIYDSTSSLWYHQK